MNVLHLNAFSSDGGAVRAVWRVRGALNRHADVLGRSSSFRAISMACRVEWAVRWMLRIESLRFGGVYAPG